MSRTIIKIAGGHRDDAGQHAYRPGVAVVAVGLVAAFLPGRKPAAQALKPPMPEAGRDRPRPRPAR